MRVKSRIVFVMESVQAEKILTVIGQSISKDGDDVHVVELFEDTEEYIYLIDELRKRDIDISETKEEVYSNKELLASELLQVVPNSYCGYPQPESDFSFLDVSFDSNVGCITI
jgi:hypothetical protein